MLLMFNTLLSLPKNNPKRISQNSSNNFFQSGHVGLSRGVWIRQTEDYHDLRTTASFVSIFILKFLFLTTPTLETQIDSNCKLITTVSTVQDCDVGVVFRPLTKLSRCCCSITRFVLKLQNCSWGFCIRQRFQESLGKMSITWRLYLS